MPITFQFRKDLKLVISTHIGLIPDNEFLLAYQQLFTDAGFNSSYKLLVDLRSTDSSPRSSDALKALAEWKMRIYEGRDQIPKIAVVAPDDLSYGLSRMYDMHSAALPGEYVVFKSSEKALSWLNVPPEVLT